MMNTSTNPDPLTIDRKQAANVRIGRRVVTRYYSNPCLLHCKISISRLDRLMSDWMLTQPCGRIAFDESYKTFEMIILSLIS